jgi:hypothetical protein
LTDPAAGMLLVAMKLSGSDFMAVANRITIADHVIE